MVCAVRQGLTLVISARQESCGCRDPTSTLGTGSAQVLPTLSQHGTQQKSSLILPEVRSVGTERKEFASETLSLYLSSSRSGDDEMVA